MAERLLDEPQMFEGDFSNDGIPDVVAIYQTTIPGAASGFNSNIMLLQKMSDGSFKAVKDMHEVAAIDPRNVTFGLGKVTYTHTVLLPTDPHCCPTGKKQSTISFTPLKDAFAKPRKPAVDGVPVPLPPVGQPNAHDKWDEGTKVPKVVAPHGPTPAEQTAQNFQAFIRANAPTIFWQPQPTLDFLTAAELLATEGTLGQLHPVNGQPSLSVVATRDGQTGDGRYCREFQVSVGTVSFALVGCRPPQRGAVWTFMH